MAFAPGFCWRATDTACVRAGLLLEGDGHGVAAVELSGEHVVLLADLRARDVLQLHDAAVRVAADDDLIELVGLHQAALGGERVDLRAVRRDGGRAHGADRRLHVLARDGGDHLLRVDALRGHAVGIHPHAHREARTVDRGLAHAGNAQEHGLDRAEDVVADLETRHRALRRAEADDAEHVLGLRADASAELLHLAGQLRLGLRHAVLHLDHVHVAVRLHLEGHLQLVVAGVGAGADHVEHVVHAVHLVLDRHRDGVEDLLRVRAGVAVRHGDRRRREARVLRDRQLEDRHRAGHRQHDGNHHRETRTLHKYARERLDFVY